ncbi:Putative acrAB operon repressor [Salinivirga cyanobacteriivorans]|uniref:AcrAB operon repressor n=1 Tax=Salinivirga cyanobacteriivorans TaxID=1307839 RepID=A0A0S2HWF6_9BACT|nr:TetR/AcrR family transcriptional regulator [Salinivirga cyanobacteriivorans]ALO14409.1 Putative acrAB operon repressor [Salinivirga cyanobacteriivorans]
MKSKKEKIVDTAIKLFAEQGFHNTSISKVAEVAGVSKGLMYNYFESKDELFKHIFDLGAEKLTENFDPNRDGVLTKEELIYYLHDIFYKMQKDREYWILFFTVVMQPGIREIVLDRTHEIIAHMMEELTAYFTEKGCEEPEAQTRYFISVMDGVGMHYLLDPEGFPIKKVVQKIIKEFV